PPGLESVSFPVVSSDSDSDSDISSSSPEDRLPPAGVRDPKVDKPLGESGGSTQTPSTGLTSLPGHLSGSQSSLASETGAGTTDPQGGPSPQAPPKCPSECQAAPRGRPSPLPLPTLPPAPRPLPLSLYSCHVAGDSSSSSCPRRAVLGMGETAEPGSAGPRVWLPLPGEPAPSLPGQPPELVASGLGSVPAKDTPERVPTADVGSTVPSACPGRRHVGCAAPSFLREILGERD
ncbi:translation initiation factor IF-2-like, partial [Choloepus didactylus]|uniref:translation initiation factor IF-2-like n=1 Tax=Choloepus didactylus TaxID=27675 RepID=UPI00189E68C0